MIIYLQKIPIIKNTIRKIAYIRIEVNIEINLIMIFMVKNSDLLMIFISYKTYKRYKIIILHQQSDTNVLGD